MRLIKTGVRALLAASLAAAFIFTAQPATPVAAATGPTAASAVIAAAEAHIGARWVYGATGPTVFDCSGLVWYAFRSTGNFAVIGNGAARTGTALYSYFRSRGLASTTNGQPGDIVVYGYGSHVGIYLGNGMVISTLTSGVRIHGLHRVNTPFTAFLHTGLSTNAASSVMSAFYPTRTTTTAVNLRWGSSTSYGVRTVLRAGTPLQVTATVTTAGRVWYNVHTANDWNGWVAGWLTR